MLMCLVLLHLLMLVMLFCVMCNIRILALQRDKFRHLYTKGQEVRATVQLFEDLKTKLDVEREARSMYGIPCCTCGST